MSMRFFCTIVGQSVRVLYLLGVSKLSSWFTNILNVRANALYRQCDFEFFDAVTFFSSIFSKFCFAFNCIQMFTFLAMFIFLQAPAPETEKEKLGTWTPSYASQKRHINSEEIRS